MELTSVTNVEAVIIEETKSDIKIVVEAAVRQSEERMDSFCESVQMEHVFVCVPMIKHSDGI